MASRSQGLLFQNFGARLSLYFRLFVPAKVAQVRKQSSTTRAQRVGCHEFACCCGEALPMLGHAICSVKTVIRHDPPPESGAVKTAAAAMNHYARLQLRPSVLR